MRPGRVLPGVPLERGILVDPDQQGVGIAGKEAAAETVAPPRP